jgi:hypothetical protein
VRLDYLLVVEHADGLDCFDRVGELNEAVAAGLAISIFVDLGPHDAAGKTEYLTKFIIVDRKCELKKKKFNLL